MTVVAGNANLPETLYIYSQVRKQATRLQRWRSPTRHRFTQRVLQEQRRLVRGRPLIVSREKLLANLEELQKKNQLGILEVRTLDGRSVDLTSLQASKPKPPPPKPHPPLDSLANDKPRGIKLPQYIGGSPEMDPAAKRTAERLAREKEEEAIKAVEPPLEHNPDPSSVARRVQEEPAPEIKISESDWEGELDEELKSAPEVDSSPEVKSSPTRKKVSKRRKKTKRSRSGE